LSIPGEFSELFRTATAAAKLPRLRLHDCRQLFAVNLVRAGTPLPDVGRMLGHKTLAMVLRYGHHSPTDATLRARDRLEEYLASGRSAEATVANAR
jgi:integrase